MEIDVAGSYQKEEINGGKSAILSFLQLFLR